LRTIKFRAKDIINHEWVYGDLHKCQDGVSIVNNVEFTMVAEPSVGQFTGRYDHNHNEIYEGDIISNEGFKLIVYWNNLYASFCVKNEKIAEDMFVLLSDTLIYPYEVIGNIYDNPKLISNSK
jgi:uncharacterized phage protein (TIGR01671 family)